jgi:Dyp-type peroxidase family
MAASGAPKRRLAPAKIIQERKLREPPLRLANIQGNILPGFNKDFQALLFLKIGEGEQALASFRQWLARVTPWIATAEEVLAFKLLYKRVVERRERRTATIKSTWINLALSYAALERLDPEQAGRFSDRAFKDGLNSARSAALGDPTDRGSPGHPENWVVGGPNNPADAVLIVASDDRDDLRDEVERIKASFYPPRRSGVELVYEQYGAVLPEPLAAHEHFGFRDGVSQPGIRGRVADELGGLLTLPEGDEPNQGKPGQDLIWPGEFVFGYQGQARLPAAAQGPAEPDSSRPTAEKVTAGPSWGDDGSFLVIRRLRQDVPALHAFLRAQAARFNLPDAAHFGALCVGRWPSGAPIVLAPGDDDGQLGKDEQRNNDFEPAEKDRNGETCPFAAHIRKVYPRDDESDVLLHHPDPASHEHTNEATTQTHRLLRRGIPFGDPYPLAAELGDAQGGERGLLFLAYQTSLEKQFEFVTKYFANNPDFKAAGAGHDPIVGQNRGRNGAERERRFRAFIGGFQDVPVEKEWVIPTGGGYFFAPSLEALKALAGMD